MNEKTVKKIIFYLSTAIIIGAVAYILVYPIVKDIFFLDKQEIATTDTSVDKSFFEKLEALQDNTIEFNEETQGNNNPFSR